MFHLLLQILFVTKGLREWFTLHALLLLDDCLYALIDLFIFLGENRLRESPDSLLAGLFARVGLTGPEALLVYVLA